MENEDLPIEGLIDLMQQVVSPGRWDDEGWVDIHQNRILVVSADAAARTGVRQFIRQQTSVHQAQVRLV